MKIWVDADACPVVIKEILYRAADRTGVLVTLVANKALRIPRSDHIAMLQVDYGFDVADNEIVKRLSSGDLVITADIPLAAEVIGKGGLGENSAQAFQDLGGVYLAIIGGTAALETTWIKQIVDVDMDDLNPESLWHFRIKDFGPLLVAMDAHGGSLYDAVRTGAQNKRAAALAHMGIEG